MILFTDKLQFNLISSKFNPVKGANMPRGIGYPKKKLKTKGKKMSFSSQMAKVNKIMSKKK
jgi:hypothetical protein